MRQESPPGKHPRKHHTFSLYFSLKSQSWVSRQRFFIALRCSSVFWPNMIPNECEIASKGKFWNQQIRFVIKNITNMEPKKTKCTKIEATFGRGTECYLRQGAGGTEFHILGREFAFWCDFIGVLRRISARNLKNTVFPSKNIVWRLKTEIFEKNIVL